MMILTRGSIAPFLNSLSARGAAQETVTAYRADLRGFMQWWDEKYTNDLGRTIRERHAMAYLNENRSTWAPNTTKRKIATLRAWAKFAGDPTFLSTYIPPTPANPEPHPIANGIDGVFGMLAVADTPQRRALVALCGLCGLRVSEACAVRPEDFDVRQRLLKVRGKGDKQREIPVSDRAWDELRRARELASSAGAAGPGTLVGVQQRQARHVITRLGKRARIAGSVASHDLRATFATEILEKTLDLRAVQELLGHASVTTTQRYTGVSRDRKRAAVQSL